MREAATQRADGGLAVLDIILKYCSSLDIDSVYSFPSCLPVAFVSATSLQIFPPDLDLSQAICHEYRSEDVIM